MGHLSFSNVDGFGQTIFSGFNKRSLLIYESDSLIRNGRTLMEIVAGHLLYRILLCETDI